MGTGTPVYLPQIPSGPEADTRANQILDPCLAKTTKEHPHEKSTLRLAIKSRDDVYGSENRHNVPVGNLARPATFRPRAARNGG